MANELLNPVAILKNTEPRYENEIVFAKYVNREFDDQFAVKDAKVGYVVNARIPVRYRGTVGDAYNPEDTREPMKPVKIDVLWGVHLDFADQDLTLTIDRFGERYLDSAAETLANKVDLQISSMYQYVSNFAPASVPGTVPSARLTWTGANVILANSAVPPGKQRNFIVNPDAEQYAVEFGATLFNPQKELAQQYLEGKMGIALGGKWSMSQNVRSQTLGSWGTSSNPVIAAGNAPVNGATSVVTSGWQSGVSSLNKGDIISFLNCNMVNPITFETVARRRTFVVAANVSDSSGTMTIPLGLPINADPTDPFQTCSALPAAGAALYIYEQATGGALNAISGVSSPQNLVFHRDFCTLAIVKQELPGGMEWSEQITNKRIGLAMRLVRGYDIRANEKLTRLEILGGVSPLREDFCCRVAG
jgi:hypothetical protein